MAAKNLAQHEQHLKLLEENLKEFDKSYQQVVDSHKQKDNALQQVVDLHKKMYGGLCDLSNLIFGLFQIAKDLRETYFEFEKEESQAS